MALDVQTIVATPETKTFGRLYQEPSVFRTSEPSGLIFFKVANGTAITAIGVGDTGELRIRCDLPQGFAYKLDNFNITLFTGTTSAIAWDNGALEIRQQVNQASPARTQLNYPIMRQLQGTGTASSPNAIFDTFGAPVDAAVDAVAPGRFPGFVLYSQGVSSTSNPTFKLFNLTASTGPWTVNAVFSFFLYPIEQADNSGLYWDLPVSDRQ